MFSPVIHTVECQQHILVRVCVRAHYLGKGRGLEMDRGAFCCGFGCACVRACAGGCVGFGCTFVRVCVCARERGGRPFVRA